MTMPCTARVKAPDRPELAMPASIIPTMAMPICVPYSLPAPPNTLVPPMNTAVNTSSMYPSPCMGHHDPLFIQMDP